MSKTTNTAQQAISHSNIVATQVGRAGTGEYYSLTAACPSGTRELTAQARKEVDALQNKLNSFADGWISMLHARGVAHVDVLVSDVTSACGYHLPSCANAGKGQVCRK